MSHAIDIDGTAEKLFLLQHLCYGSPDYCKSEGILCLEQAGYAAFHSPWGWMKSVVSNYLIECSVKLRMMQEHCSKQADANELAKLDQEATLALTIGYVQDGEFRLTLREACNKIVHASRVRMDFTAADGSSEGVHFWDGQAHLFGDQYGRSWHLQLQVANWSKAALRYIHLAQEASWLEELGQD